MVTRKAVPGISTSNESSSKANPPYPTSPVLESGKTTASTNSVYSPDLSTSPAFDLIDVKEAAAQRPRSDSDASSHGTWDSENSEHGEGTWEQVEVPQPLKVRSSQQDISKNKQEGMKDELPASLRVGRGQAAKPTTRMDGHGYEAEAQSNPWAGDPHDQKRSSSNNPYLRQDGLVADSSQSEWQEVKPPQQPSAAPPPPPSNAPPVAPVEMSAVKSPSEELPGMSLDDGRPASWETAEILTVPQQGQAPFPPVTDPTPDSQRPLSTWWQDSGTQQQNIDESAFAPPAPPLKSPVQQPTVQQQYAPPPGPPTESPLHQPPSQQQYAPPPGQAPPHAGSSVDRESTASRAARPPPISTQQTTPCSPSTVPETPGTQVSKQRNKTYMIKHINWYDSVDSRSLRQSPVLTQNANGPCPLLALVNALVLSTPQNLDTPLIEVLRSREQVSLGLLLDAVFDELMSGRRGETAHQLPDVGELYAFLLALHTGMNVNPRFVTPSSTPRGSLDGRPHGVEAVHPMHRSQMKAGAFEETREMRLYSTFNVPLIHGWTAPADSPAYESFVRSAQTFEDAQNIQFAEAELENKARSGGLTPQEQATLQDIQTIKAFLNTWPTQLTDFGLKTIGESLQPGKVAILFRNDHFSTIYKEPLRGALMTLVTDTGYSSHDEIVWESLVDVNGAASEMFSGDFRVVSHGQDMRLNQGSSAGGEDGWQTVQGRQAQRDSGGQPQSLTTAAAETLPPPLPGPRPQQRPPFQQDDGTADLPASQSEAQRKAAEQEDHDLALALQLQEEEEENERQVESRRRREQELSEQFLSNESTEGPRPAVPPRRGGGRSSGNGPTTNASSTPAGRPAVNRPGDRTNDPEAPPTYEQAWSDRPYRPAGATAAASMNQGNPLRAYDALRRQSDAMTGTAGAPPYSPTAANNAGRRQSNANRVRRQSQMLNSPGGPGQSVPGGYPAAQQGQRINQAAGVKDAEDKCCVM